MQKRHLTIETSDNPYTHFNCFQRWPSGLLACEDGHRQTCLWYVFPCRKALVKSIDLQIYLFENINQMEPSLEHIGESLLVLPSSIKFCCYLTYINFSKTFLIQIYLLYILAWTLLRTCSNISFSILFLCFL